MRTWTTNIGATQIIMFMCFKVTTSFFFKSNHAHIDGDVGTHGKSNVNKGDVDINYEVYQNVVIYCC